MFVLIVVILSNPFNPEIYTFNEGFHSAADCEQQLKQDLATLEPTGVPAVFSCREVQLPTL